MLIILPDELDILRDMQPLDRDVFYYLAERMDYETGVIGRSRRVSYGGMAYDLTEHDKERRRVETLRDVTSKQIQNSINRLVRNGLLDRQSTRGVGNYLVLVRIFWASMLGMGYCVQKPDGRQMGSLMGVLNKIFINNNNSLELDKQTRWEAKTEPDGITSIKEHQYSEFEKFSMRRDWIPSVDEVEHYVSLAGFSTDSIDPVWVQEFVRYWCGYPGRHYTQHEWTHRLITRLLDYLRKPGYFEGLRGIRDEPAKPTKQKLPEWATPPRDDEKLNAWMRKHGYGDGPAGLSYHQTRDWLRCAIESRLKQWRQLQ